MNKKISSEMREWLIQEMLAGRMTRKEAAKRANVDPCSVRTWLETRGVNHLVPKTIPTRHHKVPAELRARLVAHLLAGEITRAEAAILANVSNHTIGDWPELRGMSPYKARDGYLRRLFPDLANPPHTPADAHSPPKQG